jgi:hypothetical protein
LKPFGLADTTASMASDVIPHKKLWRNYIFLVSAAISTIAQLMMHNFCHLIGFKVAKTAVRIMDWILRFNLFPIPSFQLTIDYRHHLSTPAVTLAMTLPLSLPQFPID